MDPGAAPAAVVGNAKERSAANGREEMDIVKGNGACVVEDEDDKNAPHGGSVNVNQKVNVSLLLGHKVVDVQGLEEYRSLFSLIYDLLQNDPQVGCR